MPCLNEDHVHTWPEKGKLVIERCEVFCQYCTGSEARHRWKFAWFLRRHVRLVHIERPGGSHPHLDLEGGWSGKDGKNTVNKRPSNRKKAPSRPNKKKAARAAAAQKQQQQQRETTPSSSASGSEYGSCEATPADSVINVKTKTDFEHSALDMSGSSSENEALMDKTARLRAAAIRLAQDRLVDLGWVNRLRQWRDTGLIQQDPPLPYLTVANVHPWGVEEVSEMIRFGEHVKMIEDLDALGAGTPVANLIIPSTQCTAASTANFDFNNFQPQQHNATISFPAQNMSELNSLAIVGFPEAAVPNTINQVTGPDAFALPLPSTETQMFDTNMVATKDTPEQVDAAAA